MHSPELIFVAGCNAAGKSTFIRTRLNDRLDEHDHEIITANKDYQVKQQPGK